MVISHRGRKTGEQENSLVSFEKAIKLGADGIECDLRLNPDNEVVVSHDNILASDTTNKLLTLDELFDYIKSKKKSFFLEVKSSSSILVEKIIKKIEKENLWELVHIIGFSVMIKTALKMQNKYPKLRAMPFVNIPLLSFIRPPKKSYGVFLGWIEEWPFSQPVFRTLLSPERLKNLVQLYRKNGFKVMAGVINNEKGLKYFKNSGITDIVTDEISLAVKILK